MLHELLEKFRSLSEYEQSTNASVAVIFCASLQSLDGMYLSCNWTSKASHDLTWPGI